MKSRNCANGFPTLEHQISEMQQRGLGIEERRSTGTKAAFNSTKNACANWRRKTPRRWPTLPRRRSGNLAAEQELASVDRTAGRIRSGAANSIAKRLQAKQEALRTVEEDLRRKQEALRQAQADAFAAGAATDPRAQRNHRARPAKAGQRRPPGKTFRGKNSTRRGARAAWKRGCRNLPRMWKPKSSTCKRSAARWRNGRQRLRRNPAGTDAADAGAGCSACSSRPKNVRA